MPLRQSRHIYHDIIAATGSRRQKWGVWSYLVSDAGLSHSYFLSIRSSGLALLDLGMVTDGDKEHGREHAVELPSGKQWIQIDPGKTATIHAVVIWLGDLEPMPRAHYDVIVRVSDDPSLRLEHFTCRNATYWHNVYR